MRRLLFVRLVVLVLVGIGVLLLWVNAGVRLLEALGV